MSHYKTLAITDLDGEGGDMVASRVEQLLTRASPWQFVERQYLRRVLGEQGLWGQSFAQAEKVGHLLGADVLLIGHVEAHRVEEDFRWDEHYNAKGEPYTIYQRTGLVLASASLRGIDAATGAILGAVNLDASRALDTQTVRIDAPADHTPGYLLHLFAPLPESQLLAEADGRMASDFLQAVLPHEEDAEVAVYASAHVPESLLAAQALQDGDFVRAVSFYERAAARADELWGNKILKARAYYNLGVALGCQGRFDEAARMVEHASMLHPDALFGEHLRALQSYRQEAMQMSRRSYDTDPKVGQ